MILRYVHEESLESQMLTEIRCSVSRSVQRMKPFRPSYSRPWKIAYLEALRAWLDCDIFTTRSRVTLPIFCKSSLGEHSVSIINLWQSVRTCIQDI